MGQMPSIICKGLHTDPHFALPALLPGTFRYPHSRQACARCREYCGCFISRQPPCFLSMPTTGQSVPVSSTASTPGACHSAVPLERTLSGYLAHDLAPSTLRSYQPGQIRFLCFCADTGLPPLPLSEHILCLFVGNLASQGLLISCPLLSYNGGSLYALWQ